jgi:hypothetical protein
MNVIEVIPTGKSNAISRKDLASKLKCSDRKARIQIHEARKQYPIASNLNTGGYYLPETKEEAKEFIDMQMSYIISIQDTIKAAKRYMENKDQRRLEEIDKSYIGQVAAF